MKNNWQNKTKISSNESTSDSSLRRRASNIALDMDDE